MNTLSRAVMGAGLAACAAVAAAPAAVADDLVGGPLAAFMPAKGDLTTTAAAAAGATEAVKPVDEVPTNKPVANAVKPEESLPPELEAIITTLRSEMQRAAGFFGLANHGARPDAADVQ